MTEQTQGQILVGTGHGLPTSYTATHYVFVTSWWVMTAFVLLATVACLGLFARPTHATAQSR